MIGYILYNFHPAHKKSRQSLVLKWLLTCCGDELYFWHTLLDIVRSNQWIIYLYRKIAELLGKNIRDCYIVLGILYLSDVSLSSKYIQPGQKGWMILNIFITFRTCENISEPTIISPIRKWEIYFWSKLADFLQNNAVEQNKLPTTFSFQIFESCPVFGPITVGTSNISLSLVLSHSC